MEEHFSNTVWEGSEALWGHVVPQRGEMSFGSCAGEVAFPR